jgi:UvrD-like helicase C-terminal domain
VRQKASDYAEVLEPTFQKTGLPLRNEAGTVGTIMLQELLAEEASEILISVLRLAMTPRAGRYWSICLDALRDLHGIAADDNAASARLASDLDAFTTTLLEEYPTPPHEEAATCKFLDRILGFIGKERLIAAHGSYSQGDWLTKVIDAAAHHLNASSVGTADWTGTLDAYEGLHSVPLMTIHKSKGLEYHTVIFVGLDDGAWWSFAADQIEGTAGFFVAFTRAKQRVVFTYCPHRGNRTKIATLYKLLLKADVQIVDAG